jgi:eukaryotic-like serine/threonine-protein kinase
MQVTDERAGLILDGKYRLVEKLGEGGMGYVYLGMHQYLGKKVAVKFLHQEYATNEELISRFYREARAAAEIGHPGIVDVLDMGVSPEGEPYLVMEYLEGESLGSMLRRDGAVDLATACGIMEQVLLALEAAHEKGIVHRDLKPENIFLNVREDTPPTIKLIDFGISKITRQSRDPRLTQTGSLLGTPSYMSPEQARGDNEIDSRSDLYSMGVVLYQMLTGALPFEGTNYNRLLIKVLTEPPLAPGQANPAFPKEAEPLVMKALAKPREERFQTALEMLEALKHISAFGSRTERLSMVALGIKRSTMATASLSRFAENDSGRALAAAVFDRVYPISPGPGTIHTPVPIPETRTSERSPLLPVGTTPNGWSVQQPGPRANKSNLVTYLLIGVAVAVALVVVAGVGFWGVYRDQFSRSSTAANLAPAAAPVKAIVNAQPLSATVSITVEGAPSGAKLYFDGALITDNPFIVRRETVFLPLVVESEGYEPYKIRISTDRDQTIKVALRPLWRNVGAGVETQEPAQEPQVNQRPFREVRRPEIRTSLPAKRDTLTQEKPRGRLQKASRGANVAEDFE